MEKPVFVLIVLTVLFGSVPAGAVTMSQKDKDRATGLVSKMTLDEKLGPDAFSYYDTVSHGWKLDKGEYRILVGASSEDIRLEVKVKI